MPTRLHKAIDELAAALDGRPFVLVLDPVHEQVSDRSGLHVFWSESPPYVHSGLLREAQKALDEVAQEKRERARFGRRQRPGPPEEPPHVDP